MQESLVRFLGQDYPLEKIQATHFSILGFCGGSDSKELDCNAGDLGLIPGMGRSPGGGHRYPPQCSCLENPHGQRNLAGYSPWGHKESDMSERLNPAHAFTGRANAETEVPIYLPPDVKRQLIGKDPDAGKD